MDRDNIQIDLDENIELFMNKQINSESINIQDKVKDIVYFALNEQKINIDKVFVTISSVSKEEIKQINKKYRNVDKVTDVLSFPIFEKQELEEISKQMNKSKQIKEIELGDVFLCIDVIQQQSKEYETGILREMLYMITHGICHLIGYDHIEEEEKIVMRKLEEKILNEIGVCK
ncbi:MAG: rRNA maturation RNase YbeY [Clostridia bacterium]